MFNLDDTIRESVKRLKPYTSARDEYTGSKGIFLDANENPFGHYNRYPDPYQRELKQELAQLKKIATEQIFIGNGSDEVIDLLFRISCAPSLDRVLTFSPSYGIYEVSAAINEVEMITLPLDSEFQIDLAAAQQAIQERAPKMMFICSPNNPTGNDIRPKDIEILVCQFDGLVVVDEAYIDFSTQASWLNRLDDFPNLIILQTLSKAWGLAGARIGMCYAQADIIGYLNKVKPAYNVSAPSQEIALQCLRDVERYEEQKSVILQEKEKLVKALESCNLIKRIYPSASNFIMLKVDDPQAVYDRLVSKKVIVRNRNSVLKGALRISVGSPKENKELIAQLNQMST